MTVVWTRIVAVEVVRSGGFWTCLEGRANRIHWWVGCVGERIIKNTVSPVSLTWANGDAINKMKKAFMNALCSFIKSCLLIQMIYVCYLRIRMEPCQVFLPLSLLENCIPRTDLREYFLFILLNKLEKKMVLMPRLAGSF